MSKQEERVAQEFRMYVVRRHAGCNAIYIGCRHLVTFVTISEMAVAIGEGPAPGRRPRPGADVGTSSAPVMMNSAARLQSEPHLIASTCDTTMVVDVRHCVFLTLLFAFYFAVLSNGTRSMHR